MRALVSPVKLVIFDLEDTLCNFSEAQRLAQRKISLALEQAGVDPLLFWQEYPRTKALLSRVMSTGAMDSQQYLWRLFADVLNNLALPVGVLPETLLEIYQEETIQRLELFPDVPSVLSELSVRGYTLAILSNGTAQTKRARVKQLNLSRWFRPQHIFLSEEMCLAKPQPECFAAVLKCFGLIAEEALMVGDSLTEDIAGARALGMETLLIDRHADTPLSLCENSISSLDELLDALAPHATFQPPQSDISLSPQWF